MKNIAVVTHKYLPQPDDDLVLYLNNKKESRVYHIEHNVPDADNRKSFMKEYVKGKKNKNETSIDYKTFPEIVIYIKDALFTFRWLFTTSIDTYIGMDGLCTLFGLVLKSFGRCKEVIYWSIDFVPHNRFKSVLSNFFYHTVNTVSCKKADEVWDLSPRMANGREKYLGIKENDYKKHKVVPYGLWTDRIKKVGFSDCDKNTLVYMGHLLPKQGVDIVLKEIPNIIKKMPKFKFKIIGDGSHKDALIKISKDLKIEQYCDFLGRIDNSQKMEREIAAAAAAIAPYKKTKDNYTYYADPGKVKTYLACGVPVLVTDLPWNAKDIENNKCGMIIKDGGSDLVEKLEKIMKPKVNKIFRKNAVKYSENYDYEKIFASLDL